MYLNIIAAENSKIMIFLVLFHYETTVKSPKVISIAGKIHINLLNEQATFKPDKRLSQACK